MIGLVIFDFDDTLSMTEAGCFAMENAVAKQLGLPEMSRGVHRKTWGRLLKDVLPERFPGVDVLRFLRTLEDMIPRFAGRGIIDAVPRKNLETLDELKRRGSRTAVLTSRMAFECGHLTAPGGLLEGRIDRFYFKESYAHAKPDPRVFSGVLADFDTPPGDAVYIGDSPGDATCAKGAGLYFVACLESGLRARESFAPEAVDAFVDDLSELTAALRLINRSR